MTSALDVKHLTKSYGGRLVLRNVSFSLQRGRVYGILGPNGAGKSTCLHAIAGLIEADTGSVLIAGEANALASSRSRLGFAPDDLPLPGALTGHEFLRLHDRIRGSDDAARSTELAAAFDLDQALDRQIDEYSHGMRRKLQIIAAVMHRPLLTILDEPLRGLDPDSVAVLRHLIATLTSSGRTVLIATHDMDRAEDDCDEVLILANGQLIAQDEVAALVQHEGDGHSLERAFFRLTGRADIAAAKLAAVTHFLELETAQ